LHAGEESPALLSRGEELLPVVCVGETCIAAQKTVFLEDFDVLGLEESSEGRAEGCSVVDGALSVFDVLESFLEIDGEEEGLVGSIPALLVAPPQGSVAADQLSEFGFDYREGFVLVVAELMELLDAEFMLRGSVE
jgi:hypothetical protein